MEILLDNDNPSCNDNLGKMKTKSFRVSEEI